MHPSAHDRLVEMLEEIGIQPDVSCRAATPADIQWMVNAGYGLALVDQRITLNSGLTTRPISGLRWTADTAFVHHTGAEHMALPLMVRHLKKQSENKPKKRPPQRKEPNQLQLELRA
jgi:hypothetical protein